MIKPFDSDVASDELKTHIDQQLREDWADHFDLESDLCSQIANRLVPFHFEGNLEYLPGHGHVPYRLTTIVDVLPYVDTPKSFAGFQVPAELDVAWWAAYTGLYSAAVSEQLLTLGLMEATI